MPLATDDLLRLLDWRPLPGCPGRFVLRDPAWARSTPTALLAALAPTEPPPTLHAHRVVAAPDEVLVVQFAGGGGLISYRRADGTHRHTLNTAAGLRRKLAALGIPELPGIPDAP